MKVAREFATGEIIGLDRHRPQRLIEQCCFRASYFTEHLATGLHHFVSVALPMNGRTKMKRLRYIVRFGSGLTSKTAHSETTSPLDYLDGGVDVRDLHVASTALGRIRPNRGKGLMARAIAHIPRLSRVLFARVGRMHFYKGPVPGDERPVGGGRYNKKKIGHEVYNFRETNKRLFGYFQPTMSSHAVALERVDPSAADAATLTGVLVIFIARRPGGGQVIVGWYKNAELLRKNVRHSPGKPRGYGHYCSANSHDCVLIPTDNREFEIPSGKGGMGQSNVCYPLAVNGAPKRSLWVQQALQFVDDYQAGDILTHPEEDAEKESAEAIEKAFARSKGQGFARTPKERRALEDHSMAAASKHFRHEGFEVEDVSDRRSYDLLCRRGSEELHVEVKGTTTTGEAIVLTNNEVKHARSPRNACALFILHSIRLKGMKASGGKRRVLQPWRLKPKNLTPVSYTYRLR